MGSLTIVIFVLLCYNSLSGVVKGTSNPSQKDGFEIESKLLNESSIKTVQFFKAREENLTNRPNTFLAVARTIDGPSKYTGAEGTLAIYKPKAVGHQYSATRIKLQAGSDSIEAGWRVDPSLYGDSEARFFIRTDAGKNHCFNTYCTGFIHTNHEHSVGFIFNTITKPGGTIYSLKYNIIRDNVSGNWNLTIDENATLLGYWPRNIFTGLAGMAERIEWGGVAYSPPGTPLPRMGSGNHPIGYPQFDAFIGHMKVINEEGQSIDASNIKIYEDNSKLYSVLNASDKYGKFGGCIILYGGPGH